MGRRHVGRIDAKEIAKERVDGLFELAQLEASKSNYQRAQRYVSLALRIGQRHKVRAGHKRTYCPACHSYFIPSVNVRVRTSRKNLVMTCLECGHILRYPLAISKR